MDKTPRSLIHVIDKIIAEIPKDFCDYQETCRQLEDIKTDYLYIAPENASTCWLETAAVLTDMLGEPDTIWKNNIKKIFANEIKI